MIATARTRLPTTLLLAALGGSAAAQTSLVVDIDTASDRGTVRDLFGVNRRPGFSARDSAATFSAANLYAAFGVSQVRTHDSGLDLCGTYTAASKTNTAVSPAQTVAGCELSGTGGIPTFNWTPLSSADADLSNPANYDFSGAETALGEIAAAGAAVYLRLGESYNGPNHTSDTVAWAKVATHIYRHVIGAFKPTAGVAAVNPVFVEVHNEPDGGFWRGTAAEFHALFRETVARVRSAAAAAGRSVRIGGPGFTRSILTSSTVAGNPTTAITAVHNASTKFAMHAMLDWHAGQLTTPRPDAYPRSTGCATTPTAWSSTGPPTATRRSRRRPKRHPQEASSTQQI